MIARAASRRVWTPAREAELKSLVARGLPIDEIARILAVPAAAVRRRLRKRAARLERARLRRLPDELLAAIEHLRARGFVVEGPDRRGRFDLGHGPMTLAEVVRAANAQLALARDWFRRHDWPVEVREDFRLPDGWET